MNGVTGRTDTDKPPWTNDRPRIPEVGEQTVPKRDGQMASKKLEHLDRNFSYSQGTSAEVKLLCFLKETHFFLCHFGGLLLYSHENMEECGEANAVHLHECRGTSSVKLPPERSIVRLAYAMGRNT